MRCRKCGDRFEVRNPEPPPPEAVEPPGREPEKEPPPEPLRAPIVALEVPAPEDGISAPQDRYRERESRRSGGGGQPRPAGGKPPYYLMGLVAAILGITVALLFYLEFRRGQPSDPGRTSPEVRISSGHYVPSAGGFQMFVIRGSVRDTRKGAASPPVRLRATLFNAEKGVLAEKTFLAGSDNMEIGLPAEITLENATLQEGWIPFVTVFFNTLGIADFSVAVVPM